MTQTATRASAKTAASSTTASITEIEVGKKGGGLLTKLANARFARLLAEKAEKPLKEEVGHMVAAASEGLKVGDIVVIKAEGNVRGKVALKKRSPKVDLELLQSAFPEAYSKCVETEVYSPQFDPA
jgi:bifunctional DNA-binding transcriptional regulator/antitoxin component of YhaV-PrlF toxin-antitoxin module